MTNRRLFMLNRNLIILFNPPEVTLTAMLSIVKTLAFCFDLRLQRQTHLILLLLMMVKNRMQTKMRTATPTPTI